MSVTKSQIETEPCRSIQVTSVIDQCRLHQWLTSFYTKMFRNAHMKTWTQKMNGQLFQSLSVSSHDSGWQCVVT